MAYNQQAIRTTTVLILILIILAGIGGALMIAMTPTPQMEKTPARVEYRVVGTASGAQVAFLNDDGQLATRDATLPASYRFRAVSGRELSLSVRRSGERGAVGCAILIDGILRSSVAAEGERTEAVCTGVVP